MNILRYLLIVSGVVAVLPANAAQLSTFTHVVVIVQENRTPDNLFWELCQQVTCDVQDLSKYDILTDNWLSKDSQGHQISVTPQPLDLATNWDIEHHHIDWSDMCDLDPSLNICRMDGAATENCSRGTCPVNAPFNYVQRMNGNLDVLGPI